MLGDNPPTKEETAAALKKHAEMLQDFEQTRPMELAAMRFVAAVR